jgi:hypothetical protein
MKWIFQNDLIGRLRGNYFIPGAFLLSFPELAALLQIINTETHKGESVILP